MPPGILALSSRPMCSQRRSWAASWPWVQLESYGRVNTSLAGTLTGALTTPGFGTSRSPAIRQHQRLGVGLRRSAPAGFAALEQRRSQLHDLHDGRYPGRRLRLGPAVEHRHRARRDRRRRRLHLFQSGDRARVLGGARLHLQFRRTSRPSIRTASTCISIGARRSS